MKKTIFFAAIAAALTIGTFTSGSALAAPQPGTGNWETFEIVCGGESFTLTVNEHGNWAPGFIQGTNGAKLVPYSFTGEFTDTVTGEIFSFQDEKPAPRGGTPVTCSANEEEIDPETGHLITGEFTVIAIIRGK